MLQQRRLALLFADLGYAAAARRQTAGVGVASVRMVTELHILLTTGQLLAIQPGKKGESLDVNVAAPEGSSQLRIVWKSKRNVPRSPSFQVVLPSFL